MKVVDHSMPQPQVATPATSPLSGGSESAEHSMASTSTRIARSVDGAASSSLSCREPIRLVRRSTRSRITASQGMASTVAPLSSSVSKGKAKDDRPPKPKYLPLGPPHLEALYSEAIVELGIATRKAFYTLCPRGYLIRPLDSPAVQKRKKAMQPNVKDIKRAGFAYVDKAVKRAERINKLLDEAIERRRLEEGGDGGWPEEGVTLETQVIEVDSKKEDEDLARDFLLEMAKWKRKALEDNSTTATSRGIYTSLSAAHGRQQLMTQPTSEACSRKRKTRDTEDSASSTSLQNIDQNSPPGKRYNTRKRARAV